MTDNSYLQQLSRTTIASGNYLLPISDDNVGRLLAVTKDSLFNGLYIQSSGYLDMNSHRLNLSNDINLDQTLLHTSNPVFNTLRVSGVINFPTWESSGPITINPATNGVVDVNMVGAGSFFNFHSFDGGGLVLNRSDDADAGNSIAFYTNDSAKWSFGQAGNSTEDLKLYNVNASNDCIKFVESTNTTIVNKLDVLTDFSVSGNSIIGDAGADSITFNACAWTMPGQVIWTRTAVAGAETLLQMKVPDSNSTLSFINNTTNNSTFAPAIDATAEQGTANTAFAFNATKGDYGTTNPNMLILCRYNIGSGNTDVPSACGMLEIRNRATTGFNFTGGYNFQLMGGGTSPTLSGPLQDRVSMAAVDKAGNDRRLYIQSEAGSGISIGNDRLGFLAYNGHVSVFGTDVLSMSTTSSVFSTSILSNANGIGYTTGAGGSITQNTSKAASVTLNKIAGRVLVNNATLNGGTIVSFPLINSFIADSDVMVVNHISSGTIGAYSINPSCMNGSGLITIRNNTAGNLSENLIIQFAVIKSVIA